MDDKRGYSKLPDLNIRCGKSEIEFIDITRNGVVSVSIEIGHDQTGERADIFLERDDVQKIRDWCERVLGNANSMSGIKERCMRCGASTQKEFCDSCRRSLHVIWPDDPAFQEELDQTDADEAMRLSLGMGE